MPEVVFKIFVFCLGAVIGSFLNVCIYRMPRHKSIVRPGSHCCHCGHKLNWFDNIPFLSYAILGGKCRHCHGKIALRYFIVELLTASVFLFLFYHYKFSLYFWVYAALCSSLITVSFIDIDIQEIPDEISLCGIVVGVILSVSFPQLQHTVLRQTALIRSLLGLLAGGGSIYLTGLLGNAIFRKESMGGGDVKLMAMIGAFIGWKLALLTFFIAPFFGTIAGIIIKIRENKSVIPYGPFLSLATLISLIWGRTIVSWLL